MRTVLTNGLRLLPLAVVVLFVRNLLVAESLRSVFSEYVQVVTDPAHMLAELTFVLTEALILAPLVAFWVHRHDRRHHAHTDELAGQAR
jgi:hypothetical protein